MRLALFVVAFVVVGSIRSANACCDPNPGYPSPAGGVPLEGSVYVTWHPARYLRSSRPMKREPHIAWRGRPGRTSQVRLSPTVVRIDYAGPPGSVLVVGAHEYRLRPFWRSTSPKLTSVTQKHGIVFATLDQPIAAALVRWRPTDRQARDYFVVPWYEDRGVIHLGEGDCSAPSIPRSELETSGKLEIVALTFDGRYARIDDPRRWPTEPAFADLDGPVRELPIPSVPWRRWLPLALLFAGLALLHGWRWPNAR